MYLPAYFTFFSFLKKEFFLKIYFIYMSTLLLPSDTPEDGIDPITDGY